MGSKLAAKALMADAGVPVLQGIDVTGMTPAQVETAAGDIGYPVLVKASAGRAAAAACASCASPRRWSPTSTARGARRSRRSATARCSSSGTSSGPRHVEVQVMADTHGTVVALFERDCSVQRRHQKVLEEAPLPRRRRGAARAAVRRRRGRRRAVDYTGAGTVEFVVAPDGTPAFLEMNTRLQVEHPVTELVTGLDLVRLQLLVAQGHPLPPEVAAPRSTGHAVEARLYAEDATAGFLPATGTLVGFDVPGARGVRVDSGVEAGSVVGTHYDAMLAKVVAHGATRAEASARLAAALAGARLHGVVTNRDLLVRTLRSDAWLTGDVDTSFLERHDPAELGPPLVDDEALALHAVAATLAAAAAAPRDATVQPHLPSGWRNVRSDLQRTAWTGDGRTLEVGWAVTRDGLVVEVDGSPLPQVRLHGATAARVDLSVDGLRRGIEVSRHGGTAYVDSPLGSSTLVEAERYPLPGSGVAAGSLTAPMPGTVVRVAAQVGARVQAGEVLLVLEAMKMEHAVRAGLDGTVAQVLVEAGAQVDAGAVLVVIDEG
jgi:acetyl/propionyl-CoA carboxylase alpha subunit